MKENDRKDTPKNPTEKRAETRETLEEMQRIELKLPSLPIYVFNVKDTSQNGLCFLVKAWRIDERLQTKIYSNLFF